MLEPRETIRATLDGANDTDNTHSTEPAVVLRRWRQDDVPALYRAVRESLDHLTPWMPWVARGYTEADATEFIERSRRQWDTKETFNYAIVDSASDASDPGPDTRILGTGGLMTRNGPGVLEIGYWLHKDFTGRGLATLAAKLLTDEAFRLGAAKVRIQHDVNNTRSQAVPQRLGFYELERKPATGPLTPNEAGHNVIWQLDRVRA